MAGKPIDKRRAGQPSMGSRDGASIWLAIAVLVIVLDQLSKIAILKTFAYGETHPVMPSFSLILVYNTGAAFSFLAQAGGWQRWLFTGIALCAAGVILFLLRRHAGQRLFCFALALVLGGAIGNVIDRILYGHVVDFLLFYYGNWSFPAFNLADSAISVGAALLIFDELRRVRKTT